jgi:hypothetical protein
MSRRLISNGGTKESRQAERLGKLMTEDFSMDLERIGYYLVRNLPKIVYDRFEVVALTAGEEYDKLMEEIKTGRPRW